MIQEFNKCYNKSKQVQKKVTIVNKVNKESRDNHNFY